MARETYVYRPGQGVVLKQDAAPLPWVHGIRADGMDAVECPADGRTYDSKSQYYRAVDRAGCAILGAGEQPRVTREPSGPAVRQSMRQALEQLKSR